MTLPKRIPRADSQPLIETCVEVAGGTVVLRKDLGARDLTKMMAEATVPDEVRGLMVGDEIYYWDAFKATHSEVAKALEVIYEADDRVFVWRTANGAILVDRAETSDSLQKPLQKLAESPNIFFCGSDGEWLPGALLTA